MHQWKDSPAPVDNPGVDIPLIDGDVAMPEEVQHAAPHAAVPDAGAEVAGDVDAQVEIPEKISIEGLELTSRSSVHDLRRICKYFGINQSGSKQKMYERIVKCHIIALRRQGLDAGQRLYEEEMVEPREVGGPGRLPSLRVRKLHELTHLPFQDWCAHCVACKSRADQHRRADPQVTAERSFPTIQIDLMYGVDSNPILLLIDAWTRYVRAVPMKSKSSKNIAEILASFIGELGYVETIEIAHDNEPTINAAVYQTRLMRNQSGLKLVDQRSKNFDKGRTSMAERAIQTVRCQSKTLVHALENQVTMKFDDKHIIHQWAVMHAAWLINRFHYHSAVKPTPYQQIHGRPYRGKVACFASLCYGLDGTVDKHHPQWLAGVWLGKDLSDHDILAVGDQRLVRCKSVRQTDQMWDDKMLASLVIGPSDLLKIATHSKVKLMPSMPPLPVPVREEEEPSPEAASDPPSKASESGDRPEVLEQDDDNVVEIEGMAEMQAEEREEHQAAKRLMESYADVGVTAAKSAKVESRAEKHGGEEPEGEKASKQPRLELSRQPGTSSTSSGLQASPMNAANVRQVSTYGGVDVYVEDEDEEFAEPYMEDLLSGMDFLDDEAFEDEKRGPPEVDEATLQSLDQAAAIEEIDRLRKMSVIEDHDTYTGNELVLDTRQVFDWRYRDGQWKRRCRLVAREFRSGAQSTEETFAPTSSKYVVNILLILCLIHQLSILVCDIKDAFLTVPQRELVLVEVPSWIKCDGSPQFWKLCRCLPGQRRAALHWNEFFESVVQQMGFIAFEPMPTVFRHTDRRVYLTIHVDDLLVIGSDFDCKWFLSELSLHFNLKSSGPFSSTEPAEVQYLKKNIIITPDGIVVEPCKQYIPKLLELLHVENRREKTCPHHNNLEVYSRERILPGELLNAEQARIFRGGLGLCLYLAQDRPDVQEAVRVLSTYMGSPTVRAMSALKHLACYLKGTAEYGIFLTSCSVGTRLQDHWPVKDSALEDPSSYNVECYCDSNWGGCKTSRKSTSSGMVFLNGCLVLSLCKSQSTIALSSCEAELLAMTHMTAEAIMVCNLCRFLLKLEGREVNSDLDFIVYTDSSSAKALAQRRGVGRLKHVDLRHLWVQACVRQKLIRLKKVGTQNNVADLNTKNLSLARRRFLFGLCGLSEDQKKIIISTSNDINLNNPNVIRRIALILAGLPVADATSMEQVAGGSWWMLLATAGVLLMVLVWMIPGGSRSRSHSPPGETASQRRRRYQDSSLSEVSDPEAWMLQHHHSDLEEEDEPEVEPPRVSVTQRRLTYESRVFLMFTSLVDAQYGRWGRRHQPHFEWEDNYPTEESLTRTFRQMIVMSLCLDRGKVSEVEEMLLMIENDGDNDEILAGLTRLEEYMDPDMNLDMTLPKSIAWLYHRFRDRMVGPQYDKVRWAGEVFASPEESMRVSQERALEAIEHRMEMAYILNEQDEYEALERYRDHIVVAYECWHGTMAGIWKADSGCWHKMDRYISFIALFSYWWLSVFSIACFLFSNW